MKSLLVAFGLIIASLLLWQSMALGAEAQAVMLGVVCGITAAIPIVLGIIWRSTRTNLPKKIVMIYEQPQDPPVIEGVFRVIGKD